MSRQPWRKSTAWQARTRPNVTAIFYLVTHLIGLGLVAPLIGAISEWWAIQSLEIDTATVHELCVRAKPPAMPGCAATLTEGMAAALVLVSLPPLVADIPFPVVARRHRQAMVTVAAA